MQFGIFQHRDGQQEPFCDVLSNKSLNSQGDHTKRAKEVKDFQDIYWPIYIVKPPIVLSQ